MIGSRAVDGVGRAALAAYDGESRAVRLHTAGRWRSCPFPAVEQVVPRAGRVLDLGCGHGLFSLHLARSAPEREVTGVDVDDGKIEVAARAAARVGAANASFRRVDPGWTPEPDGGWDAVTIVDVLYLVGSEAARRLLAAAAAALVPGGVLVVKELDVTPAWKYRLSRLQEVVATRVVRITEGERLQFVPPVVVEEALAAAGLAVESRRLDWGRLHPHHLVVGRAVR